MRDIYIQQKLQVSFAKEPYKIDYFKEPTVLSTDMRDIYIQQKDTRDTQRRRITSHKRED